MPPLLFGKRLKIKHKLLFGLRWCNLKQKQLKKENKTHVSPAGQLVIWYTRLPVPPSRKRTLHPGLWMTNRDAVAWIMELDMSTLMDVAAGRNWDWEATSTRMRRRMEALERELDDTGRPVFVPVVKARVWYWPSWDDWQNERNARLIWIDLGRLRGWDVMPLDIVFRGQVWPNRPWQMLFPMCIAFFFVFSIKIIEFSALDRPCAFFAWF